ncbi:hypothetical protein C922_02402 [Plasmodium inui San Antonio 1]|uniref:Uncharacterized protein n=1 Tax=Plasmodium inui San Antonio 1 TaxID=1237626 RepID=W7A206_9APIC|nr:hypothetical protein C922_02402 [Plasmodium inui San Antonio 1]EUD67252.1 hypothetical protein C922_02402 [Plasmodium inui San Antonio 1]
MHALKRLPSDYQSDEDVVVEGRIRPPFDPKWNSPRGGMKSTAPSRERYSEHNGSRGNGVNVSSGDDQNDQDDQDGHENRSYQDDQHYYHYRDEEDLEPEEGATKWGSHADRGHMTEGGHTTERDTSHFQSKGSKNHASGLHEHVKKTKLKMYKNLIEKRDLINSRNFFQIPFEQKKRESKHQQIVDLAIHKNKWVGSPSKLSSHLREAKLVRPLMKEKTDFIIPSRESLPEQRNPNCPPKKYSPSVEPWKEAAYVDTHLDNQVISRIAKKLSKRTYRFNHSNIHICTFKSLNDNYVRFFRRRLMKSKIHALLKIQRGEETKGIVNPFMKILLKYETPFMWKKENSHQHKQSLGESKQSERGNVHPLGVSGTRSLTPLIKEGNSSGATSNVGNLTQEGDSSSNRSSDHRDGLLNGAENKRAKKQSKDAPLRERPNGHSPVTEWSTTGGIVDSYLNENADFFEQNFLEEEFCVGRVSMAHASDPDCCEADSYDADTSEADPGVVDPCEVDLSLDESIKTLISNCSRIFNHSSNPPQEDFSQANQTEPTGRGTSYVKLHPQNYDEIVPLRDDSVMNLNGRREERTLPRQTNPKGEKCQLVKEERKSICDDSSVEKKYPEEEKHKNNSHATYFPNSRTSGQINSHQFEVPRRGEEVASKELRPSGQDKEQLYTHTPHEIYTPPDTHKGEKICTLRKLHKNVKHRHPFVLLPVWKQDHLKGALSDQKNRIKDEGKKKTNFCKMAMKTYPNVGLPYTPNCRLHITACNKRHIIRKKNNKKDNETISYFRFYKKNLITTKGEKKKRVNSHRDSCNECSVTPVQNVISPCRDSESAYLLEEKKERHKVLSTLRSVQESVQVTEKGENKQNGIARQANHNLRSPSIHTTTPQGNISNEIYVDKRNYKEEINSIKGEEHSQNGFTSNRMADNAQTSSDGEPLQGSSIKNDRLTAHRGDKGHTHLRRKNGISTHANDSSDVFTKNRIGGDTFQGEDSLPDNTSQDGNKIDNTPQDGNKIDNAILEERRSDMSSPQMNHLVHEIKLNLLEGHVSLHLYGENGTHVLKFSIELEVLEQNCKLLKGLADSSSLVTNSDANVGRGVDRNAPTISPRSAGQNCSDLPSFPTKATTRIIQKEDIIKNYCSRLALNEQKEQIHRTISNSLSVENFKVLFTLLKMKNKMNILLLQINEMTDEIEKLLIMIEKKLEEIESLTPQLEFLRSVKKQAKVTVIQNCMNFFLRITSIYSNICTLVKTQNAIFSHFKFNNEIINSYLFFVKKFSIYISNSVVEIQSFYVQIKNMQNEEADQNFLNRKEKSTLKIIHNKLENHLSIHYRKIFIFKQILDIYLIELNNFKKYQKDYMISRINILINSKCPYDLLLFSILVKSKSLCKISVRKICYNFDITNFQTNKKIYALFLNKKIKNNILKKIKTTIGENAYVTLKSIFFYNELNGLIKNALRNGGIKGERHLSEQGEETLQGNSSDERSMESPQEKAKSPRNLIDTRDAWNNPFRGKTGTAEEGNVPTGEEENQKGAYEKHDGGVRPTGRNQPSVRNSEIVEESNESVPSNVTTNSLSTCTSLNDCEYSKYLQNIHKILKTNNALTVVKNIRLSLDIGNLSTSSNCLGKNKEDTYKRKCTEGKKSKISFPSTVQAHLTGSPPKNEKNCIKLNCARKKKIVATEIDQLRKVFKTYERGRKAKEEKDPPRSGSIENAAWKTHPNGRGLPPPRNRRLCCKYKSAVIEQPNPPKRSGNREQNTLYNKKQKKKRKILENIEKIKEIEKNYKQLQEIQRQEKFKKKLNEWKLKKITKRNNISLLKIRGLKKKKKNLFTSFVKKDINGIGTVIRCKINGGRPISADINRDICTDAYPRDAPSNHMGSSHTESGSSHLISEGGEKSVKDILDNLKNSTPACSKMGKTNSPFVDLNEEECAPTTHQKLHLYDDLTQFDDYPFDRNHLNRSGKNRHNGILNYEEIQKDVVKTVNTSEGVTNPLDDKIIINHKTGRNLKKENTNSEDEATLDNEKNKEYILHQTEQHFTDSFFNKKLYEPSPSETHFFTAIEDENEHTDMSLSPRQSKNEPKRSIRGVSNKNIKYKLSDYTQKWNKTERIPFVCITKGQFSPSGKKGVPRRKVTRGSHTVGCTDQRSEVSTEGNYFPIQEDEDARVNEMAIETSNEWVNRRKKKTLHQIGSGENNAPFGHATHFPIEVKHKMNSKMVNCGRKKPSDGFYCGRIYKTKESIERRRRIDNYAKALRGLGPLKNIEMWLKNIKNVPSKVKRKDIIEFLRRRQREGMASNHLIYKDGYVFLKKNLSSKF